ncbi:hypothetical protein VOLCADRAFT_109463 [Volvox carteri f. nagariensis]|uniref:peptidylprolyl isomerase n=1 Tax=Volvox carteri f. nagariensis TaxID=3068 RepID=D8UJ92_VOLCA|nr:uncharacterized protein VOLCADRAFT_109463 [Volvox carteri f. nagariensis]EFJ40180.1 hypothetical protein VOLCADRAFT_109463 [Volvox carteri f. nagariensis]|eukprot:XP_002958724.1 hypothetical protein VOLCADRAFT_109463 [Volvox carteri f. nagariensis]
MAMQSLRLAKARPLFSSGRRGASTFCTRAIAKQGDYCQVHYTGTLDDGSVFDSSRGRDPLEFVIGAGKVIKGFDLAVTGLAVGGTRKQRIEPAEAYGEADPNAVISFPISQAPDGLEPGVKVQLSNGMIATVKSVDKEKVTLDLNHELAGKPLTFDVELMKLVPSERLQRATFAAGCFWGPELAFQRVPGVLSTEVGYSNGKTENPTYEDVCGGDTGHAEVVQVMYDPEEASYERLLEEFWARHNPTQLNRQGNDVGTQYRSAIFTHTAEQLEAALKSKEVIQAKFKEPIVTQVEPIENYHPAEPYHQQYLARGGRFGRPQNSAKGCNDPIRCYG